MSNLLCLACQHRIQALVMGKGPIEWRDGWLRELFLCSYRALVTSQVWQGLGGENNGAEQEVLHTVMYSHMQPLER